MQSATHLKDSAHIAKRDLKRLQSQLFELKGAMETLF